MQQSTYLLILLYGLNYCEQSVQYCYIQYFHALNTGIYMYIYQEYDFFNQVGVYKTYIKCISVQRMV